MHSFLLGVLLYKKEQSYTYTRTRMNFSKLKQLKDFCLPEDGKGRCDAFGHHECRTNAAYCLFVLSNYMMAVVLWFFFVKNVRLVLALLMVVIIINFMSLFMKWDRVQQTKQEQSSFDQNKLQIALYRGDLSPNWEIFSTLQGQKTSSPDDDTSIFLLMVPVTDELYRHRSSYVNRLSFA